MTLRKRILVNGLLAALPLALIGYLFATLAGLWVAMQSSPRQGPLLDEDAIALQTDDVTGLLIWKLPLFLAAGGFLFVAIGEFLRAMWKPGSPLPSGERGQG